MFRALIPVTSHAVRFASLLTTRSYIVGKVVVKSYQRSFPHVSAKAVKGALGKKKKNAKLVGKSAGSKSQSSASRSIRASKAKQVASRKQASFAGRRDLQRKSLHKKKRFAANIKKTTKKSNKKASDISATATKPARLPYEANRWLGEGGAPLRSKEEILKDANAKLQGKNFSQESKTFQQQQAPRIGERSSFQQQQDSKQGFQGASQAGKPISNAAGGSDLKQKASFTGSESNKPLGQQQQQTLKGPVQQSSVDKGRLGSSSQAGQGSIDAAKRTSSVSVPGKIDVPKNFDKTQPGLWQQTMGSSTTGSGTGSLFSR
jgi:hypothetical protein